MRHAPDQSLDASFMTLDLHPDFTVHKLTIGAERAPLLVIDNFIANADALVDLAASQSFGPGGQYFPGLRIAAPAEYQQVFSDRLRDLLFEFFQLSGSAFRFSLCHYSLVTTPAGRLQLIQRIPHFDALESNGLASVHYLFRGNLGGTAFYRHRKTGFEYIDTTRREAYFRSLESENGGPNIPRPAYINGDTPLYEQIAKQDGVFNRMLIYRRNSLHSGCIDKDFVPDPNPRTGRLSINCFIDMEP
ncbi:MAG TPA: DUF6445 family protein [Povalibacter sp.]|nr:DUF6445 family protein [Povalibacter sp.]